MIIMGLLIRPHRLWFALFPDNLSSISHIPWACAQSRRVNTYSWKFSTSYKDESYPSTFFYSFEIHKLAHTVHTGKREKVNITCTKYKVITECHENKFSEILICSWFLSSRNFNVVKIKVRYKELRTASYYNFVDVSYNQRIFTMQNCCVMTQDSILASLLHSRCLFWLVIP